jgi:O-succinylbenzoate synthase
MEASDGSVGFGEASPLPTPASESVDELEAFCRSLGERITEDLDRLVPGRFPTLRNALECARGIGFGSPRHSSLGVAALLPPGRTAPEVAAEKAEVGFRSFKWKVGVEDARDEMAILDDLLAELPSGSKVRLDANGAWTLKTAERWLDYCSARPVEFVEQPVGPELRSCDDILRGLAADYPVPIALDESIRSDDDVDRWLALGWPGVFVVKPSLLRDAGGVIGRLAESKARVVFSSALETGLGAYFALRRAFSWPDAMPALGFGVWPLFEESLFDGPSTAPFIRVEDVDRFNPETLWNALS